MEGVEAAAGEVSSVQSYWQRYPSGRWLIATGGACHGLAGFRATVGLAFAGRGLFFTVVQGIGQSWKMAGEKGPPAGGTVKH